MPTRQSKSLRPPQGDPKPAKPKVRMSWQDWLPYLEGEDATDEQKRQMIEMLWSIMQAFADAGWAIGDTLDVGDEKSCGKDIDLAAVLRRAVLRSEMTQDQSATGLTAKHAASVSQGREDAA